MTETDLPRVEAQLKRGPKAFGYETGLWTTRRVAVLIEQTWIPPGPCVEDVAGAGLELPAAGRATLDGCPLYLVRVELLDLNEQ